MIGSVDVAVDYSVNVYIECASSVCRTYFTQLCLCLTVHVTLYTLNLYQRPKLGTLINYIQNTTNIPKILCIWGCLVHLPGKISSVELKYYGVD